MIDARKILIQGFKTTLPFQTGVIPFGLLYATLATKAGLPWWLVLGFSIVVFAGSSQLVFIDLLTTLSSPFQALLGSNFVNLRHLIYSAGISKDFANLTTSWKLILSYLLTDQLYAIVESHKSETAQFSLELRKWYYLGSGLCTWIFWQFSSGLGIYFGRLIPTSWNLDFAIPLIFMPLLCKVCKNRFSYITSGLVVVFVILFQNIPYGIGLFSAIICASLIGYQSQKRYGKAS